MARASTGRSRGARPHAGGSADGRSARSIEDQLFFNRLRRRAKWVFLLLAIVFAGGFVFFGVGAGGSGIGDYFSDLFNRQPQAGGESVEDARERVAKNPEDASARLALADALQREGQTSEAIRALERYTALRPKDTDALERLAALYDTRALDARRKLAEAELASQETLFAQELQRFDSPLAQALGGGPIIQALQAATTERTSASAETMRSAYAKEAEIYQRLATLLPDDPSIQLQLGQTLELSGDTAGAIAAYTQFLKLAPDDANAPAVKQRIAQLNAADIGLGGG